MREVYSFLDVKVNQVNANALWARPIPTDSMVTLMPNPIPGGTMPDVTGMSAKDAVFLLEEMGLKVMINGKGPVSRQSLQPGTNINKGKIVILDLSTVKT
jgi:cell division protein FtsI (penicillin-binding protein 3)